MRSIDDYLTDVVPRVYLPVLHELLTAEEFATVAVSIRQFPDGPPRAGSDSADGWTLVVEVCGEPLFEPLSEPTTDAAITERFYADVQDWISETTFGWGQWRGEMWPSGR